MCYPLEIKLLLLLLLLQILVGLLYSRCEICVFIFLSSSLIFSLFSNNATQHDLLNRQSVNQSSSNQSVNQSINQSVSQSSVSQYRTFGKHGVYHHILGVMSKIHWACDTAFYAIICYNDIKHENVL